MRSVSVAERLLSLLTAPDRATAIVGDLLEREGRRSPTAFHVDVIRVWFALWRAALVNAPSRVILLAGITCLLMTGPMLAGIAAMALFPAAIESGLSAFALLVIWSLGSAWTGALLTHLAPDRGVVACLTVATISGAILTAFVIDSPAQQLPLLPKTLVLAAVVSVPLLLVVGSSITRHRKMSRESQIG